MSLQEINLKTKKKFERINLLQFYNINTVKYYYFKVNSRLSEVNEICKFEKVSIRTQSINRNMDVWFPKWINLDKRDALHILANVLDKYEVLISEAINPALAIKCGNIAILEESLIVEIVYGSGTLDRLTSKGIIDKSWVTTKETYNKDIEDKDILEVMKAVLKLPYKNVIIEFSCYCENKGIYNQKYVAWDILNWR